MRGGRRANSGRRGNSTNRPKAGAALLAATKLDDTAEHPTAVATLRRLLAQFSSLAETARLANDAANFQLWSRRASEIAQALLPHETPRLNAIATVPAEASKLTEFRLSIFDERPRQPVQIEAKPVDIIDQVIAEERTPAPEPPKEEPKAEAPPTPSPPPEEAPGPSWAEPRSLFQHPALFGAWARGSWRN
jgi:hypothetical protein